MFNFLCHGNFFDQEKKNTLATGLIPPNPLSLQRFNDSVLLVKHNPYSNPVYTRRGHLPFDLVKYNQILTKTLLSGAARKKKKIQDVISVRLTEGVLKVHSMQSGGSPVNQNHGSFWYAKFCSKIIGRAIRFAAFLGAVFGSGFSFCEQACLDVWLFYCSL